MTPSLEEKIRSNKYARKMRALIESTGGVIEDDLFVVKPGCVIIARTELTTATRNIFDHLNIDTQRPEYEQLAEFNGRLTYLSFPDQQQTAVGFNDTMTRKLKHLSVYGTTSITFLIAGITVETSMELIAHSEAKVGRVTTSKTKAMNCPLYRIQGSLEERGAQKEYIRRSLGLRDEFEASHNPRQNWGGGDELFNILNIGNKVTALTYTMNLKDFHKLFIGRLPEAGNEREVREICGTMCEQLQVLYPLVIRTPEEYQGMDNGQKYRA